MVDTTGVTGLAISRLKTVTLDIANCRIVGLWILDYSKEKIHCYLISIF